jgi:hypothetical protein
MQSVATPCLVGPRRARAAADTGSRRSDDVERPRDQQQDRHEDHPTETSHSASFPRVNDSWDRQDQVSTRLGRILCERGSRRITRYV